MGCGPIIDGKPAGAAALDALDWKNSARLATTAALPANTLAGSRLTANANGAWGAIDGFTLALLESILVKNEAAGAGNGIYTLIDAGSAGTPWILQRRDDADTSAEVTTGMTVPIEEGTINERTAWTLTTIMPIVLGTTALVFMDLFSLQDLTSVLTVGNTSGGIDLQMTAGDQILMEGAAAGDADAAANSLIIGDGIVEAGTTIAVDAGVIGTYGFRRLGTNTIYGGMSYIISGGHRMAFYLANAEYFKVGVGVFGPGLVGQDLATTSIPVDNAHITTAYLAGADSGDGVAGADDLVIGDGTTLTDRGLTFHTNADSQGNLAWTNDGAGTIAAQVGYGSAANRFEVTINGTLEAYWSGGSLRPVTGGGQDLGTVALPFGEIYGQQGYFAGATLGDATAGADDLVIGDGNSDAGLTIYMGIGNLARMSFSDGTNLSDGQIRYDGVDFVFRTNNSDSFEMDGAEFTPLQTGTDLGRVAFPWDNAHIVTGYFGGAASGDAHADADDVVIGDGAGNYGLTFHTGANTGRLAWSNGTNDLDGAIRYGGAAGVESFNIRTRNVDRLGINDVAIFPLTTFNLGADGSRFQRGYIDTGYFGGASSGDAHVDADDVVIGDGVGNRGMTIFAGTGSRGTLAFTDAVGGRVGYVQYNNTSEWLMFGVASADQLLLTGDTLRPANNDDLDLGASGTRFVDGFINAIIYDVEPSAGTITVGSRSIIMADASAASIGINMPTAVKGRHYEIIVLSAAYPITVSANSGDNVNGAGSKSLSTPGRFFITAEDAATWRLHGPVSAVA